MMRLQNILSIRNILAGTMAGLLLLPLSSGYYEAAAQARTDRSHLYVDTIPDDAPPPPQPSLPNSAGRNFSSSLEGNRWGAAGQHMQNIENRIQRQRQQQSSQRSSPSQARQSYGATINSNAEGDSAGREYRYQERGPYRPGYRDNLNAVQTPQRLFNNVPDRF